MRLDGGTVFAGDFRIVGPLKEGGMGAVYVAEQISTGARRAIKLMRPELVSDERLRARFAQEARVGSKVKSDHVVQVIASGVEQGTPWIAMELIDGLDLNAWVQKHGLFTRADARDALEQLCHALAAAHDAGIVHRDLKPENVVIAEARRAGTPFEVKVLDFGLAKLAAEANPSGTAPMGTLAWMAPEQTETQATITPAADVWSLGLLAFWLLTGHSYWRSAKGSTGALVREIVADPLPGAAARAAELRCAERIPDGFAGWFDRCVAREPARRFADAGAAWSALAPILGAATRPLPKRHDPIVDLPTQVAPTPPGSQRPSAGPTGAPAAATVPASGVTGRRRAWLPWMVAGVAIATGGVVAYKYAGRPSSVAQTPAPVPPVAEKVVPPDAGLPPLEDPEAIWKVLPGDAPKRGAAQPLVTIIEFSDFQCPFSAMGSPVVAELIQRHPDDVALYWRDHPLAMHDRAMPAAGLAREVLAERGLEAYWQVWDRLTGMCTELTDENLMIVAKDFGLDPKKADAAIHGAHDAAIEADERIARDWVWRGTPSFFVNGKRLTGARPIEEWEALYAKEKARAQALLDKGVARENVQAALVADGLPPPPPDVITLTRLVPDIDAPMRGGKRVKTTLYFFGDHADPFTRLSERVLDEALRGHEDDVIVYWLELPHAGAEVSQLASTAAQEAFAQRGHTGFWKMHACIGENVDAFVPSETPQPVRLGAANLTACAKRMGLDLPRYHAAIAKKVHADVIDRAKIWADKAGIKDAPAVLITAGGDTFYRADAISRIEIERLIERSLAQRQK